MAAHDSLALTDGGIETSMLSREGLELPCFAAFPLLESAMGRAAMRRYFDPFLRLADEHGLPFVADTATWRASPDWGARLGYDAAALAEANRGAVEFVRALDVTVNGVVGPRGDGYVVGERMSVDAAAGYHAWQVGVLADAGVDRVTALTLTYPEEAIGVIEAAAAAGMAAIISFTVETDGRLPDETPIAEAIERVDAQTGGAAEFFMLNCAHPTHIAAGLDGSAALARIGGLRVNASSLSHAELDAAEEIDEGDPEALGREHARLRDALPAVTLLGGCCGTDHRHVEHILTRWIDHGSSSRASSPRA